MSNAPTFPLSRDELCAVTAYAAACARLALPIFERDVPSDPAPRDAIDAALTFAQGGPRNKRLRDTAWAALRSAKASTSPAAAEAARAAMAAAGAAYLHPLPNATQVRHILGSAAHAARAAELSAGEDLIPRVLDLATPAVTDVLHRYPAAPPKGGRVGELMRIVDAALRNAPL